MLTNPNPFSRSVIQRGASVEKSAEKKVPKNKT